MTETQAVYHAKGQGENGPKVCRTWDELPPVVSGDGISFSTRVLERQHRQMVDALRLIANTGMDARQCAELATKVLKEIPGV